MALVDILEEMVDKDLKEACDLLHSCLEWDNGGERSYDKIVEFLNKVEGKEQSSSGGFAIDPVTGTPILASYPIDPITGAPKLSREF